MLCIKAGQWRRKDKRGVRDKRETETARSSLLQVRHTEEKNKARIRERKEERKRERMWRVLERKGKLSEALDFGSLAKKPVGGENASTAVDYM